MKTASTITIEKDLWAELARVNLEVKDAIDSGNRDAVKKAVEKERRILAVLEKRWPRVDAGLASTLASRSIVSCIAKVRTPGAD